MGPSAVEMVAGALAEAADAVGATGGTAEIRRALAPLAEHVSDADLAGFAEALAVTAALLSRRD